MMKHVVRKSSREFSENIFSAFNIKHIDQHVHQSPADFSLVEEMYDLTSGIAQEAKLDGGDYINCLMNTLQSAIVELYPADQVAPKLFVLGCSLLKSSHKFAEGVTTLQGNLTSLDNVRILKDNIKQLTNAYTIDYSVLPGLPDNLPVMSN